MVGPQPMTLAKTSPKPDWRRAANSNQRGFMSASPALTLVAIATALPGREKMLRAAQEKLVAETVREPGCLRYELHQSLEDGQVLVFVETWASETQWRAHMQGEAIKRFQ